MSSRLYNILLPIEGENLSLCYTTTEHYQDKQIIERYAVFSSSLRQLLSPIEKFELYFVFVAS